MILKEKGTYIIAEAGVNHNGNLENAKKLIDIALDAGADCVKFQLFDSKKLTTNYAEMADYQVSNTKKKTSQLEMLKKLELSRENHIALKEYCAGKNIDFLSSPFDVESAEFLNELGLKFFKIPSGELINIPFLRKIASFEKPVVLSTGMSNMHEVKAAVRTLLDAGLSKGNMVLLHCNTEYPTPLEDVNLRAMLTLSSECGTEFGYSDHTKGIDVSVAAVAMGATVIEKHYTIDKNLEGPDHAASLDPKELKSMVESIRRMEIILGSPEKTPSASEEKNIKVVRKSIVANKDIGIGEIFTEDMLTTKRPGSGMSPIHWDEIIGKKSTRNYKKDEQIFL